MTLSQKIELEFLPRVQGPGRYSGGEKNRIIKKQPEIRWALGFPDLYEIGMSHQGMGLLYHILNTRFPSVAAERVYLPDNDACSLLRNLSIPLYTLESRTPLKDADIVGISLGFEMAMPGMLEMLDLGGIPIRSVDRSENDPIVVAGGPIVFNPEPFADFVDVVALGDGEELAAEITECVLQAKRAQKSRNATLDELSKISGLYVPAKYNLVQAADGFVHPAPRNGDDLPLLFESRTLEELKPEYYSHSPLLPIHSITHDRISLEVMRGCTRGCRFCHAGMIYRPVRERTVDDIVQQAVDSINATGYEEVSLSSLSTSDYTPLPQLMTALGEAFRGKGISLSFPSLRPDSFTREMAEAFPEGRKGTLTFAPEAGTQRMRDVINKNSREEDLLKVCELAFSLGYNGIKLYFMIGLPTERKEDLEGIFDLAMKVAKARERKGQKVGVAVSPLVPKTHTPFQWFGQEGLEPIREKLNYLRDKFKSSPVRFSGHNPYVGIYEGALARGDRRLGRVIERVWKSGGTLEAWSDHFSSQRWEHAFIDENLTPETFTSARSHSAKLPWSHISKGHTTRFLEKEWKRAERAQTREDCRLGKCDACGLYRMIPQGAKVCHLVVKKDVTIKSRFTTENPIDVVCTARVKYTRHKALKWIGHLDLTRLWGRLLRWSDIDVSFSQGFNPHPRLSFGPPLPVGCGSNSEYIDIDLAREYEADELLKSMNISQIDGMEILAISVFRGKCKTLNAVISSTEMHIPTVLNEDIQESITHWLAQQHVLVERRKKDKSHLVDIRPSVLEVELDQANSRIRLLLSLGNGPTARLGELIEQWNISSSLLGGAYRTGMFVHFENSVTSPLEAVASEAIVLSTVE